MSNSKNMPPETEMIIDEPRETDWEFEELFGDVEKPKMIPFPKITIQNQ